jgi:hypothetical protein
VDDATQLGTYRFFEQAGTGVKVTYRVAIGYNHEATLVVLEKSS